MFDIAITEYVLGDEGLAGTTLDAQLIVTYVYIPPLTKYEITEATIDEVIEAQVLVEIVEKEELDPEESGLNSIVEVVEV